MVMAMQPQQFISDFAHDVGHAASPYGLAGSGFGLEPVSEQAELAAGLRSDLYQACIKHC